MSPGEWDGGEGSEEAMFFLVSHVELSDFLKYVLGLCRVAWLTMYMQSFDKSLKNKDTQLIHEWFKRFWAYLSEVLGD